MTRKAYWLLRNKLLRKKHHYKIHKKNNNNNVEYILYNEYYFINLVV